MSVTKVQAARIFLKDLFKSQKKSSQKSGKIVSELGDYANGIIKPFEDELQALANSHKATIKLYEGKNYFMVNSGPITSIVDYAKMGKADEIMSTIRDNVARNANLKEGFIK